MSLIVLLLALLSPIASALTPATLLTPELERESVNLAGLNDGVLSYFDSDRRLTREPVEHFVRLHMTRPDSATNTASASDGLVELVDGQRIVGQWVGSSRDGEALHWQHPRLGRFTLRLEDLRVIIPADHLDHASLPQAGAADLVRLHNGDQFAGFIVAMTEGQLELLPDGTSEAMKLPRELVASIHLANPRSESRGLGDLVVLSDGSRVRATALSIVGDDLSFTPSLTDTASPVTLRLDELQRVDFDAAGVRLIELADQTMQTVDGGRSFGLDLPPWVDPESVIHLHAPITVEFDLPDGVQRFAATAELDLPEDLPDSRRGWADFLLTVGDGGSDPLRLHAEAPNAQLNLEIDPSASSLILRLDPAANGPILDRLRLRDAVLLQRMPDDRPGTGDER